MTKRDLSGVWHFKEEFGYGVDEGKVTMHQNGQKLVGSMVYEERIDGDLPFVVCVDIEGHIADEQIRFKGVAYEIFDVDDSNWQFNLEERMGVFISDNRIEGTSIDVDGIEGKFVMTRDQ